PRVVQVHHTAVDPDLAGAAVIGAEEQTGELGASGAEETGQAHDLAFVDLQVDRLDRAGTPEAVHADDRTPPGRVAGGGGDALDLLQHAKLAAEHRGDQFDAAQIAGQVLADPATVAQDRHPVGDLVDLLEEVGDEEDRRTLVA